jgi:hypothetical protein
MSPLLSSFAGASSKAFGLLAGALKPIQDLFTRTTSGSLGTATSGQSWVATRGTWSANGTQATSADAASNNSIASIPYKSNVVTSASVSGGTGPVFWLTDANSWWSAVSYNTSTETPYSCNCQSCGNTCTSADCAACGSDETCNSCTYSYTAYSCTGGNYVCNGSLCCSGISGNIVGNATSSTVTETGVNCYYCGSTIVCRTCQHTGGTCGSYSCNCQTCYNTTYNYYLRLLQSLSGTVSTATSDISLASAAAAISVETLGNAITAKAYSNTTMTTQLGTTMSYTPTTPTKGTSVGIIKTQSPYTQGSTIDNFTAE